MMRDVDPERIQKLVSSMRDSVRMLTEIKGMPEPDLMISKRTFHKLVLFYLQ